jgi:hypothetical protein
VNNVSVKDRQRYDFTNFKVAIKNRGPRLPIGDRVYSRWGYRSSDPVSYRDFELDEIERIIREGDLEELRELSRYYYRTNGEYRNNIDFLARLFLYDTMVIPVFEEGKGSKTQILKAFYNACRFVDALDLPNTLMRITTEWLKTGIYNGILRQSGDKAVIHELPLEYCRTRFKDMNNLNILEFNLHYFDKFQTDELRMEMLETFPEEVQEAFMLWYGSKRMLDPWVEIPASAGGVCFCFSGDQTPALIASIPDLKQLKDAVKREEKRDNNELYKLLIERMPITSEGELVFQLDEVAEIHSSVADMLSDIDTVDVLTTFGDTDLESLQETSAATQSSDRIEKYKKNAYDALGRSSIIFNADGSSTLAYSIKKDEALMQAFLNVYETWIAFHLNDKFARTGLTFDFQILPTTVFNRKDLQGSYFSGAQYGYSKMYAGVAMGIKQMEQLALMNFENEFLDMSSKMIPLQSSYTTSGTAVAEEGKSENTTQNSSGSSQNKDINNKGGRPELPDEEKSEKTQANIAAAG